MSSSQQTTNLGLPIYGDSDVPSWKDTNTPFQTLDDIIGQGGGSSVVPLLDFTNAIALSSTAITTTSDGCIVGGMDGANNAIKVQIDGKDVNYYQSDGRVPFLYIPNIPKGSSINLSRNNTASFIWFVPYLYQAVEPVINVYNEAEVELDYANPLHVFSSGNLSYTATKDCWLMGVLDGGSAGVNVSIDGTPIAQNWNAEHKYFIPPLKVTRGSVITTSIAQGNLKVYDGTISGSVGQIGGGLPDLDYSTPLATLTSNNKTYTCTKSCYMIGTIITDGVDVTVTINGTQVCRCSGVTTVFTDVPLLKLKRGDVVALSATAGDSQINILDII